MNPCFPEWNMDAELPVPHQKKPMGFGHELVELLWRNGEVVLHSQTHKKPGYDPNDCRQVNKHDQSTIRTAVTCGNQTSLIQDEETVSWLNCPIDDPFDKEFSSPFLSEISANPIEADKPIRQSEHNKVFKFDPFEVNHVLPQSHLSGFNPNPMPPPRFHNSGSAQQQQHVGGGFQKGVNIPTPVRSSNVQLGGNEARNLMLQDVKEGSVMTVGSSHCGSNQVANDIDTSRFSSSTNRGLSAAMITDYTGKVSPPSDTMDRDTFEPANTSSSGGSGSSYARTCNQSMATNSHSHKRKSREGEEPECQSKSGDLDSAGGNKSTQKSGTARRSRAAEVHNLSERRRRDRINEKMKALQELLPHSTKTDKASMLDEAIEYLKSLQMQLQMMWMGGGMASMMFPGVQHYMSRMGIGMGPPSVSSIHNAMNLARLPLVDPAIPLTQAAPNQAAMCQSSMLNAVNYQRQLQNPNFSDQYASYMGFHPLQGASQPINIFSLGSHSAQQSQQIPPPTNNNAPTT